MDANNDRYSSFFRKEKKFVVLDDHCLFSLVIVVVVVFVFVIVRVVIILEWFVLDEYW